MDTAAFRGTPGKVMRGISTQWGMKGDPEYDFYVPPPVPRELELSPGTLNLLSEADRQVGALRYLDKIVANPHLLIAPYLRKEAVLSSRIEGTQASLTDLLQEEADTPGPSRPSDVREVRNYVRALEQGRTMIEDGALDLSLIRRLHEILMEGVRGAEMQPGRFRTYQNWIGPEGTPVEQARYVPPSPDHLDDCLADLERFLLEPPVLPPLVQVALLHYQFEAIHPFGDGNGRVGRLLIPLFLLHREVLSSPLLYLSAYFEQRRNQYYGRLHAVQTDGAYDAWIRFFLEAVVAQAQDAAAGAARIADLHQGYREVLSRANATGLTLRILDKLFENPYISIPHAAEHFESTYPTAQRAIEKYLVANGILEHVEGTDYPKLYVANRIIQVIEGADEPALS